MSVWLGCWRGYSARTLQTSRGLELASVPGSTYWTGDSSLSVACGADEQDLLLLHSHVAGTRCADHFSITSHERDRGLRIMFEKLLDAGRLALDASNDEWFRRNSQVLLPDPQQEADWGIPALLATLAPPRGSLAETPDPPGLGLALFPYQRQALTWMLRQESPLTRAASVLSPLWRAVRTAGTFVPDNGANRSALGGASRGELVYQNVITGQLLRSCAKPVAPAHTLLRGGILADAPGLGKTAELAALILAHPFDPAVPDTSANGNTMRERGVEHEVTRVKTTLVVVTDSIQEQWIGELRRFTPGLTVASFPDDVPALQRTNSSRVGAAYAKGSAKDVAAAVRAVEGLDVLVITYGKLRSLTHGPVCEALRNRISWWRVVLDEAQTCFNATSAAALAVSHLWKQNVWCTTGTPIGHTLDDLHGLFEILDSDPWASQRALSSVMVQPYLEREPGSYGRMHALLRSVMLRREGDHPDVVAATQLARPVWVTPVMRLSPPEAARYQEAYQAVFRRADRELAQLHARELRAEQQLRDEAASQRLAVADAVKAQANQVKQAAAMQAQAHLAAAASAAAAAAGQTQESVRKGKGTARTTSKEEEKAANAVADALLAQYLRIPVRTRLYNSRNADGEPLVGDRQDDEAPSALQAAVMRGLCEAARLALEDTALALWNAEQGAETMAQIIQAAEGSLQPDRWVSALQEATDYLTRLLGDDDEDDGPEDGDAERAASARRRQLRRARQALLSGRGGGSADGVRGTAGLAGAVTALRRMINHPSLPGPTLAGLPQPLDGASGSAPKASFFSMLEAARTAVLELEVKHSCVNAAWQAAGGGPGSRHASEVTYVVTRLNAARKRLELLQLAVQGQEDSVCCICLDAPGKGDPRRGILALPCLHPACDDCLSAWLKEGQGCPQCRAKVVSTVTLLAASQAVTTSSAAAANREAAAAAAAAKSAVVSPEVLQHGTKLAWLLQDVAQRLRESTDPAAGPFKCVVFSAWEAVLAKVSEALQGAGISVAEGFSPPHMTPAQGATHCQKEINRFKGSRSGVAPVTVLLLPLRGAVKSAAAGLNLQEATRAYLFDPSTSRALEEQAVARVCRIGQTRQVTVVRMCAQRTLDEDVLALQAKLGAGRGGAAADEFVSGEDLTMLFGISAMHQQQQAAEPALVNDGAGPSTAIVVG